MRRNTHIGRLWLGNYLDRHIYGSWRKLGELRWPFLAWLAIIGISFWGVIFGIGQLDRHYLTRVPAQGGVYREGMVGEIRRVNPILPESAASVDINHLVFSGLTRVGPEHQIVPDLATRWEVSADAKTYTFYLRKGVLWHDGRPFSAEDVAFTIALIQNPDSRSPLVTNWQGVKTEVIDPLTIKFVLPKTFTPFLSSTTVGILPKHILSSTKPSNLKIDEFNLRPIGTGPFRVKYMKPESENIDLLANEKFYRGRPMLDKIRFVRYEDHKAVADGIAKRQIDGVGTMSIDSIAELNKYPFLETTNYRLPAYVGIFFNLQKPPMNDLRLRQGLAYATDRTKLINDVLKGAAGASQYPIPAGYTGFNNSALKYLHSQASAKHALSQNKDYASGSKIKLSMVTINTPEMVAVADHLKTSWAKVGVMLNVIAVDSTTLAQNYIRPRNFDLLLYGENAGIDSDVYSFWHSSQINDPGLNITGYNNPEADKFLESGRIAKDPQNRSNKYAAFIAQWARDLPTIILYSPYYVYAQSNQIEGTSIKKITEPADRWYGVEKWSIRNKIIPKSKANSTSTVN